MKCFAAALLLGSARAVDPKDISGDADFKDFQHFINKYRGGASYSHEVETIGRFTIFKENLRKAEERTKLSALNARPGMKPETHGITQFMDLTPQEFRAKHTGFRPVPLKKNVTMVPQANAQSIDWNAKGVLTPIKNQGQCGSCWAFSATEQLESQYKQKYGTLQELSPQQVTSCSTNDDGCGGGNPINAWGYVSTFGGQEANSAYPYTSGSSGQTGTCKSNKADVVEDVGSGYTMISSQASQESNMLSQIQSSPMSIVVDATLWQTYTGGVITTASGCGTAVDHAVQATGFNAEGNYWIIRNSWGESWGEQGFVWVEYGHNVCAVTYQSTIVSVAKIMEAGVTV